MKRHAALCLVIVFGFTHYARAGCVGSYRDFVCGDVVDRDCVMDTDLSSTGTCFKVFGSDITIDGNGHTITGDQAHDRYGVYISSQLTASNVTVKNLKITGFYDGIYIFNSNGHTIIDNEIYENDVYGIFSQMASDCTYRGNTIRDNGEIGLSIFEDATNNLVEDNTITGNDNSGIKIVQDSTYNTVTGNTVSSNQSGIVLEVRSHNNEIADNIANNNVGTGTNCGIKVSGSDTCTITGNTTNGNHVMGIWLTGGGSHTVSGNTCNSNGSEGIYVQFDSNNNIISGNTVNSNGLEGIYLWDVEVNTVENNTLDDNRWGIYLDSNANSTIIQNNEVMNSTFEGVTFVGSANDNALLSNTICGSGEYDVNDLGSNNGDHNYCDTASGYIDVTSPHPCTYSCPTCGCDGATKTFVCGETVTESCTMDCDLIAVGTCFTVGASIITIDGNGHSITGNDTGLGINLNDRSHVTVKNFTITGFAEGIRLSDSMNNDILDNQATENGDGISLYASTSNELTGNTTNSNSYGITLNPGSNNNTLTGNTASSNTGRGILVQSDDNTLTNNTAENNTDGIRFMAGATGNVLNSNRACDNSSVDIYDESANAGDDNTCDTVNNWDDTGTTGCTSACVPDGDGDGYSPPDDCDDSDPDIHPGADEICDGEDNDCNDQTDEDAASCDHLDGLYNYGDLGPGCSEMDDPTAEQRDYSCSSAACGYSVTGTKDCDNLDGYYGGGNSAGCGDDPAYEERDYYVDSENNCQYNACGGIDCDNQDTCSGSCQGTVRHEFEDCYVNSGSCTCELGPSVEDCATKPSTDSDGAPDAYTIGASVTDYTGCSNGSCTGDLYSDYCQGDVVYEYGASGTGYVGPVAFNCLNYERDFCQDGRYIYHDEWACSGITGPGYCADLQDTLVQDCGVSYCDGTCPGCEYVDRGCSGPSCHDQVRDPDEGAPYCTGCNLAWGLGGEMGSACCGDDSGEYARYCHDAMANDQCGADNSACCNDEGDCVDHVGNCKSDGQCYPFGTQGSKSYCFLGSWIDPDQMSEYCTASGCGYTWFELGPGYSMCCGDDPGEDFIVPGTGNSCCYNGMTLPSGQSIGSILCLDGELYDCNNGAGDDSGLGIGKYTCDVVAGKYCGVDYTWTTLFPNGCPCSEPVECNSGQCKDDYDGSGKWCAGPDQCPHDGMLYEDGIVADCLDESNLALCTGGAWEAESCGDGYCQAAWCFVDSDNDGWDDMMDNCPDAYNPQQDDQDYDGAGDACDNCWYMQNFDQLDTNDNCPSVPYSYDPECGDACEIVGMCPCPGDLDSDGWLSPSDISQLVSSLLPYASSYYWVQADPATCGP